MTYLSFDSYIRQARESEGTIRVAKGTEAELVNKGTLGNSLATFFTNIGRAIGSVFGHQPDQTKAQRNEQALVGFRKALVEQFGQDIGQETLRLTGLRKGGTATELTGKNVTEAEAIALQLRRSNREVNRQRLTDCLPPSYETFKGGKIWESVCEKLELDANPFKSLTPERLDAYQERLECAFRHQSEFGKRKLSEGECAKIAAKVLEQVLKLDETKGDLQRAQLARQNLRDAMVDLIVDIGEDRSPRKTFDSLLEVHRRLDELLQSEKRRYGAEDVMALRDEAVFEAIYAVNGVAPGMRGSARDRLLEEGSVVRALYGAVDKIFARGGSEHQLLDANRMRGILSSLVAGFSSLTSTRTETRDDDVKTLFDSETLKPGLLDKARETIAPHFESRLTDDREAIGFLEFTKSKEEGFRQEEGVLIELERCVRRHCAGRGVSLNQGCTDFQAAIRKDSDLSNELKEKLYSGLRALESERLLGNVAGNAPELKNLNRSEIWRLTVAGKHDDKSPWTLEVREPGARTPMQDTLQTVFSTRTRPLSGDYLERLYKAGPRSQPPMTDQAKEKANEILQRYTDRMKEAVEDEQKLELIDGTIKELLDADVVETGATRTLVFGLMNRMLLDAKLDLCVLRDPDDARQPDFVDQIREGQDRFRNLLVEHGQI